MDEKFDKITVLDVWKTFDPYTKKMLSDICELVVNGQTKLNDPEQLRFCKSIEKRYSFEQKRVIYFLIGKSSEQKIDHADLVKKAAGEAILVNESLH